MSKNQYELYGAPTSNVYKIQIMFKELGIEYDYHPINIMAGEQFKPEFLSLNKNNKVPVIVDKSVTPSFPIFESGAILIYLAEKYGKLLPSLDKPFERSQVFQWVSWQISGLGPFLGQYIHFSIIAKEKIPYAIERYSNEMHRLFGVLESHLKENQLNGKKYVVGNELSIADISIFGWSLYLYFNIMIQDWENKYPSVKKYLDTLLEHQSFKSTFDEAEKSFKERHAQLKKD